jgi:hypothetical protein
LPDIDKEQLIARIIAQVNASPGTNNAQTLWERPEIRALIGDWSLDELGGFCWELERAGLIRPNMLNRGLWLTTDGRKPSPHRDQVMLIFHLAPMKNGCSGYHAQG